MAEHLTNKQLERVALCEDYLGYKFEDSHLALEAITHASFADTRLNSYERLEFLGDSILGFIVCDYLFQRYPDWLEGQLTQVKSVVVSRHTCALIGADLRLQDLLNVGKGIGSRGDVPTSLLANAFESIVGAIYLDGGIECARDFVLPLVIEHVEEAVGGFDSNYKSQLQQYSQKLFGLPPNYRLIGDRGPDHDKSFHVFAQIEDRKYAPAWGKNKKTAEQRAAANALAEINGEEPPFVSD